MTCLGCLRVSDDLGESQQSLLTSGGAVSHSLTSLVLTGQASPHLHNGIVWRQMEAGARVSTEHRALALANTGWSTGWGAGWVSTGRD